MGSATKHYLNLNSDDRKKYEEKLVTADSTVFPDPYTLVENWKDILKLLPEIIWADIYNYLINTPSLYTNENLKAYKSLEAYNFFVSGHVHDVAYHGISNLSEFCFIKTKVIILDFLKCFASMLPNYTVVVTYFVFILTYMTRS